MHSSRFAWYDSVWLWSFIRAKTHVAEHHPALLDDFVRAFDVLRTPADFHVVEMQDVFEPELRRQMFALLDSLQVGEIELSELLDFGRMTVHDHPFFTALQAQMTDEVSRRVGERVEPSYNFLSLYDNLGVCEPHMDAPSAKWTFDYCIRQSSAWPIRISQVRPWPEDWTPAGENWEHAIKSDPDNRFSSYALNENDAIIFGGSSQWHYRERIEQRVRKNFCHLVFFHYIPKGASALTRPEAWAELFGIPELEGIVTRE